MSDLYIVSRSGRDPNEIMAELESALNPEQLPFWQGLPDDAKCIVVLVAMRDGISAGVEALMTGTER